MTNTAGYITGALSGLALLCGLGYGIEKPKQALDAVHDTKSSLVRMVEKPDVTFVDALDDAMHDLGQRNPQRALRQLDRISVGLENTPYQDQKLTSAQYRNSRNLVDYLDHEVDEEIFGIEKGDLLLGALGTSLGLALVGYLSQRK